MKVRGFTLIELIITMVLVGILAITVIPRFADQATFDARGFHDGVIGALRYAHKTAVAQRRNVCVDFGSNSVSLQIASASGTATCDSSLNLPGKDSNLLTASNAAFSSTPTDFTFSGLGAPSVAQTLQVTGASGAITIETNTGYVHE